MRFDCGRRSWGVGGGWWEVTTTLSFTKRRFAGIYGRLIKRCQFKVTTAFSLIGSVFACVSRDNLKITLSFAAAPSSRQYCPSYCGAQCRQACKLYDDVAGAMLRTRMFVMACVNRKKNTCARHLHISQMYFTRNACCLLQADN